MPTISQVIETVNRIKPNRYGEDALTKWLSNLDGRAALETVGANEAPEYSWPEDAGRALLIEPPFSGVYQLYLVAMIDFHNREMESYSNDMEAYNSAMREWMAWYRRTNRPAPCGTFQNVLY